MQKLTVLVLAAVVGACVAYGPHYSFFLETSLLNCMVPNPRRGLRDQPDTKVEEIPIAQFHIVYNESGFSYFAPISFYESPVAGEFSGPLRDLLLEFAGDIINPQVTSTGADRPRSSGEAVASQLFPQRIITEGDGIGPIVLGLQNNTDEVRERLDELGIEDAGSRQIVIDAILELNRRCEAVGDWVRLPFGRWFPEWLYAAFCTGAGCSLPSGLNCHPVLQAESIAHTVFLRWDCCWSLIENKWEWQCGWRKVYVAHLGRCECGCGPVFQGDGYYYTVGIRQPSILSEGNI